MFINTSKIMFMMILIISTLITVASNSWLGAWMGLEINLLSFIPLMTDNNLMSTESSLKYFLIQALASAIFLFSVIFIMMENLYSFKYDLMYSKMLILSSLLMKSGTAPFHFWFPVVMQGLSWMNSMILMTWQKIAPFLLMSYMMVKPMIIFCAIMSSIIGAIGGLNQTSLFKLMAYSSINHLGWMLMAMFYSEKLWLIYFMFYTFLSITLIMIFHIFNISHMNQLYQLNLKTKNFKFFIFLNFLSLGGLPPFLGFIPKWLIVQSLSFNNQLFIMVMMIISTLITLYFYLRMTYTSFMFNYNEINWIMKIQYNNYLMNFFMMLSSFSIMGLLLISMVYMIF